MKLDCILTAVNDEDVYLGFIPIFIKTWNKLYPNVDVKIVLISTKIPENLIIYKNNIILFEPIKNILTSFTAQFIRLLYPCILNYKNGVMITDMDMLPMNRTYYTNNIIEHDDNKFIYYRKSALGGQSQIAMCYNIATPSTWKDIFKIDTVQDIKNKLIDMADKNNIKPGFRYSSWSLDQRFLYTELTNWNKATNNFICLTDRNTKFKRLCRSHKFDINNITIRNNIADGKYTDYHCLRPMRVYSKINWEIYNLL